MSSSPVKPKQNIILILFQTFKKKNLTPTSRSRNKTRQPREKCKVWTMHQGRRWHANEGILPTDERTGCRVQRNYSWTLQLQTKVTARNGPDKATAECQQSALIKSHTAARKWPFLPQEYIFSLFISQAPAAHWSLHAGMSHSLASLWRIMMLSWMLLTATIHF